MEFPGQLSVEINSLCAYVLSKAANLALKIASLHSDNASNWNTLGLIEADRPDDRYLPEARDAFAHGVAVDQANRNVQLRANLALMLAKLGLLEEAEGMYKSSVELRRAEGPYPRRVLANIRAARGDTEEAIRPRIRRMTQ